MRAFLQSLDEKVWQAIEIGWTKPKEVPADWDDSRISRRMLMGRASTRTVGNPVLLSSRVKTKGRRMLRMTVNTLFPQDPSALGVKASDT